MSWQTALIKALQEPLPGTRAHAKMAPSARPLPPTYFSRQDSPRQSSVLILLYPGQDGLYLPFIQRPVYEGPHSGQISLPGGKCEPCDPNHWDTALRETREELGIDTRGVQYLGTLSEIFIPYSNFIVVPQVGFHKDSLHFQPDPYEVNEVLEVKAAALLDQPRRTKTIEYPAAPPIEAPYYDANGRHIWGATAMILSELIEIFNQRTPYWANALRSCNAHSAPESL